MAKDGEHGRYIRGKTVHRRYRTDSPLNESAGILAPDGQYRIRQAVADWRTTSGASGGRSRGPVLTCRVGSAKHRPRERRRRASSPRPSGPTARRSLGRTATTRVSLTSSCPRPRTRGRQCPPAAVRTSPGAVICPDARPSEWSQEHPRDHQQTKQGSHPNRSTPEDDGSFRPKGGRYTHTNRIGPSSRNETPPRSSTQEGSNTSRFLDTSSRWIPPNPHR
jgi:hypothetical protein